MSQDSDELRSAPSVVPPGSSDHSGVRLSESTQPGRMRGSESPLAQSWRDVLLRLQNNIKLRRLQAKDLEGALDCTRDMLRLAPVHAGLWREAGMIEHKLERIGAALQSLDKALEIEPRGDEAARIRSLVEALRNRLN